MSPINKFKTNNFDLIRLVAAIQVAVYHAIHHLEIEGTAWLKVMQLAPGVPIFFFVSGFLISRAWESNPSAETYVRNRLLRIYPALWVCVGVSVLMIVLSGYLRDHWPGVAPFFAWVLSQMSIAQFYNPSFLREFGVGVVNGSLWTICVELQFYCLVPLLWIAFKRIGVAGKSRTSVLVLLAATFLVINQLHLGAGELQRESIVWKFVGVSFIPWFYMFLVGMLFQEHFSRVHQLLAGRALFFTPLYFGVALVLHEHSGLPVGNEIHPLLFIPLAATVVSIAYTGPSIADRLLRRNDISYGIYIYHMPVINAVIVFGVSGSVFAPGVVAAVTVVVAGASWFMVERPAIRRKKSSIHLLRRGGER